MTRVSRWSVVIVLCALAAPVLRADVKTREKALVKFEGILGGAFKLLGGSAACQREQQDEDGPQAARMASCAA